MVVTRLGELQGRVLRPQDWQSLLSAARLLLPRLPDGKLLQPAEANLVANSKSPTGKTLSSLVNAFSSLQTYLANRRYSLHTWMGLLRDFYILSEYLIPVPRLQYGSEVLRDARKQGETYFWQIASVIEPNEPIYVRQAVKDTDIELWSKSSIKRLKALCSKGERLLELVENDEPVDRDEYEIWEDSSREAISAATEFFRAFRRPRPAAIDRLRTLVREIPPPVDEDEVDKSNDDDAIPFEGSSYWTVDRIFEDL